MSFTAKDVCVKAITVEATRMLSDARDTMLKYNISRIIVEHNQKPVGMVTEKGISRFLYKENNDKPLDEIVISKAMRSPLVSVTQDTSIKDCAKLMLDNGISSLIVKEKEYDNGIIKLFTKSDLVKLYSENYKEKFKINDFMNKQVFTVSPSNSLHTVMKMLVKERISRVVVTNRDNKIVGIVTSKDLMPITAFAEGDRLETNEGYNNNYEQDEIVKTNLASIGHAMIVSDVMKKPIITVKSTDDLAIAAQIMTDKRISGLPVTDYNGDYLTGIVTKTDVIKALVTMLNQ
ncbi:MAG TPA: CBS domain-containing protein [Candidatus Sulfopaludibacter sp.]|nr:CBS domain-containing protein [Candidatus Sulfopaludibacter sp.]